MTTLSGRPTFAPNEIATIAAAARRTDFAWLGATKSDGTPLTGDDLARLVETLADHETYRDDVSGIVWDITLAKEIVAGRESNTWMLTTHPVDRELSFARICAVNADVPGIVVPLNTHFCLIDGNHRYAKSVLQGRPVFYVHRLTEAEDRSCRLMIVAPGREIR